MYFQFLFLLCGLAKIERVLVRIAQHIILGTL
jgi:hypothetical protein